MSFDDVVAGSSSTGKVQLDVRKLRDDLAWQEGFSLRPYVDTEGFYTVGWGHNLDAHGQPHNRNYSMAECEAFFTTDIAQATSMLDKHLPWWRDQTEPRQRAIANLCFSMGWGAGTSHGLHTFVHTLEFWRTGEYEKAADGFLHSLWAQQVGARRAKAVTDLIRTG